ncbi:hypothetical protein [Butyrivibrio sp. AC2005]|uniref:hypothetical protein n=1 Tax=Butyrivibrio sp. AC2005 TaxID=1280672 RepID=UPI000416030D|nr:hypothetical protein [Butyrivibrio sp. AC2005]
MEKKHIYYVVKTDLHYYPPCVTQIRILRKLGVKITVLYGSSDDKILSLLRDEGIDCVEMIHKMNRFPGILDKINNFYWFRYSVMKYLRGRTSTPKILWFGNVESMLPFIGALGNIEYVISFLELLDTSCLKRVLSKSMAQNAAIVTTCEETRSYIMKVWFHLDVVPYTIPNKPYYIDYKRGDYISNSKAREALNTIGNSKYIIYQGIFQNYQYISAIASVLRDSFPDIYLLLVGIDKYNVIPKVRDIHKKTVILEYIPAPEHLQLTGNAYIGAIFYKPDTLNKAFCAPNKIFEYSYFGLPMLCNDIPGLKNTVGKANAGLCIDFSYQKVINAIEKIDNNYDYYSNNSRQFYESVDNISTLKEIASKIEAI